MKYIKFLHYFLYLLFWNYYLNWKKKRRFKLNIYI